MRFSLLVSCALLCAAPALGQPEELFGRGKPPTFQEQELDRRFKRSLIARLLNGGAQDPNCGQVIGGLLTALGEVAPMLHKRDENFLLDPALLAALNAQLTSSRFSGPQYLGMMVRRVLIDGKMPEAWLTTATQLNEAYKIIDLAKLKFLQSGFKPIDSFLFTLPALRHRHHIEIERATTVSSATEEEFRDRYLDHDVAWTDFMLLDIAPDAAVHASAGGPSDLSDTGDLVAHLQWVPPKPEQRRLLLFAPIQKPPAIQVRARLRTQQYLDLSTLPRGRPVTVRGRLWAVKGAATEIEIRDALLFESHDWSGGALLADRGALAGCPAAINEVTGIAPSQPGGFSH